MSRQHRLGMVDRGHPALSTVRQCALLGISRSGLYYRRKEPSEEDLSLMKELDRQYLETPFYGSRRMKAWLEREGTSVNRKRVQRLTRAMGLRSIYRRPKTSRPDPEHRVYPYLLGKTEITRPNQVWAADITHVPMARGFLYLAAVMDWDSRYVVSWKLSNTLDTGFCMEALAQALKDQGVRISMDGKGRYADNILVERLWRTVKYEEVYLKAYSGGKEANAALDAYFRFYNTQRPHQSLGYQNPAEVFYHRHRVVGEKVSDRRGPENPVLIPDSGVPGLSLNSVQLMGSTSFSK